MKVNKLVKCGILLLLRAVAGLNFTVLLQESERERGGEKRCESNLAELSGDGRRERKSIL